MKVQSIVKHSISLSAANLIRGLFLQRRERNDSYSLTAFARDLGISVSTLSRTLNGRRPVSLKFGLQVSSALGLDELTHKSLIAAILSEASATAKISKKLRRDLERQSEGQGEHQFKVLEIEEFQAISQWFHLAILNLARLPDFKADPVAVAQRLGISSPEAQGAMERLQRLQLLEVKDGSLKRSSKSLYASMTKSHLALRKFHLQMIQKGMDALSDGSQESYRERSISSATLTCSATQLETIKEKIESFHLEIIRYLEQSSTPPDSVYQLNTQFFPLTRKGTTQESI